MVPYFRYGNKNYRRLTSKNQLSKFGHVCSKQIVHTINVQKFIYDTTTTRKLTYIQPQGNTTN